MFYDERGYAMLHLLGQRVICRALVGELRVASDRGNGTRIKQRCACGHMLE
jgi:hypothetical protein